MAAGDPGVDGREAPAHGPNRTRG
eukprot:COSAG02_NODE_29511_length_568_cov_0.545842_1_plen_23_part_10